MIMPEVLETRILKDEQGNVVANVSLPVGTSEEKWEEVRQSYLDVTIEALVEPEE